MNYKDYMDGSGKLIVNISAATLLFVTSVCMIMLTDAAVKVLLSNTYSCTAVPVEAKP